MNIIKLDAIDSTNDFLKGLSINQNAENFTVVTAENQTKGKGQMGSVWDSEPGKNLIMSVLLLNFVTDTTKIFDINIVFSLSIFQVLEDLNVPDLSIKWPNDIMSYNYKVGGILIENNIKSNGTISSILGLGLNVNQINFDNLPHASSLTVVCKTRFDKEEILLQIINKLKQNIALFKTKPEMLRLEYSLKLFKIGRPMAFEDADKQKFMGIIQGVSAIGKCQILLENDQIAEYDVKEVKMLF